MTFKTLAPMLLAATMLACPADALARDPGDVDPTGRRTPPPNPPPPQSSQQQQQQQQRFVPERMDPTDLHGRPQPQPAERRRLYERVEQDFDRGNGRIEDQ